MSANLLADGVPALCQACAKGGGKRVREEREVRGVSQGWSSNPISALEPWEPSKGSAPLGVLIFSSVQWG